MIAIAELVMDKNAQAIKTNATFVAVSWVSTNTMFRSDEFSVILESVLVTLLVYIVTDHLKTKLNR